jgi:hypothetical protein
MQVIDDIFRIWPTISELARDINRAYPSVCKWKQRRRIPQEAWADVIEAARARRRRLTLRDLQRLTEPRASARARRR